MEGTDDQNMDSQLNEIVLGNVILRKTVIEELVKIELQPIIKTILILRRIMEQKQEHIKINS